MTKKNDKLEKAHIEMLFACLKEAMNTNNKAYRHRCRRELKKLKPEECKL